MKNQSILIVKTIIITFFASSLLLASAVYADPPETSSDNTFGVGALTLDPTTGLEWLDHTLTQGKSVNDILNGFGGYIAQGLEISTTDESLELLGNAGITVIGSATDSVSEVTAASNLITLLGETASSSSFSMTGGYAEQSGQPGTYCQVTIELFLSSSICNNFSLATPCARTLVFNGCSSPDSSASYEGTMLKRVSGILDADNDGIPDDIDNCPDDSNPFEACSSGSDCLGPSNSCDLGTGFCVEQSNNDGDSVGDVCDADDDNDGTPDTEDNCPIESNPFQEDDDFDGLGNVCDSTFNEDSVADQVENEVVVIVESLTDTQVSGGNGMISKLAGNGGVAAKVANAVNAYDAGLIDLQTYVDELNSALNKLGSFENQLNAKINKGKIVEPEATLLTEALISMEATIQTLLDNAN